MSSREGVRCTTPLKVKVMHSTKPRSYKNAQNRDMTCVEGVIADATAVKQVSVYNRLTFPFMKTSNSILLLNAIIKPEEVVITNDTKVILIPEVHIPEKIMEEAERLKDTMFMNYEAPNLTIGEVEGKPEGTVFTATGQLQVIEGPTMVKTKWNTHIPVLNGYIADNKSAIAFAFWRNLAELPLTVGKTIKVVNGVRSSTTDGQPKITGGKYTTIEVLDTCPFESVIPVETLNGPSTETGQIIGLQSVHTYQACPNNQCYNKKLDNGTCLNCKQKFDDSKPPKRSLVCSFMVELEKDNYTDMTLFTEQFKRVFPDVSVDSDNLQEEVLTSLPKKINFTLSPKKNDTVSYISCQK